MRNMTEEERPKGRFNQQIWRLAKWLWTNLPGKTVLTKNEYYDKALELQKAILNNEFTGGDNHRD